MSQKFKPGKILVAVDGSESSAKAAETASRIAYDSGAELTILHVLELPPISITGDVYVPVDKLEADARKEAERFTSKFRVAAEGVGAKAAVDILVSDGSVVDTVVRYAENGKFDLIVAGTRGLGGFKRLILGSVAAGIVHYAHCSVLIVR
ncbi:MAG: universal stress protein [Thermoplasmata archaeon]|uniref:Universal stress protein n=1 Tax=Candidatus Sysuiplasma superficiale TaxID=2823368 RepID=A0A8J8CAS9_9ARCH|nr:universal stress protein [Candidatus Sysuiplasma superficiale]MBX8643320.1 universal stress protein [Candidatus Sysuiplasma superficiale]MCL4346351.1 universal stress protein [Candidatus Thermoplasmatota archaeon]MCL5437301.1 universal stress protein [Candidatus Thermoplasmatota archaeon]